MTTTKGEMLLLQRLQNQLMRILTNNKDPLTPTASLLEQTQMLSVYQLSFMSIAVVANKAALTGKPHWLASQLQELQSSRTSN